jgi:hypothetical protein
MDVLILKHKDVKQVTPQPLPLNKLPRLPELPQEVLQELPKVQ